MNNVLKVFGQLFMMGLLFILIVTCIILFIMYFSEIVLPIIICIFSFILAIIFIMWCGVLVAGIFGRLDLISPIFESNKDNEGNTGLDKRC